MVDPTSSVEVLAQSSPVSEWELLVPVLAAIVGSILTLLGGGLHFLDFQTRGEKATCSTETRGPVLDI